MQQDQKVRGASNGMKLLFLMFCVLIPISKGFAQNDDFEFQKNFISNFKYPTGLKNACTPTFTNLLIVISEEGVVGDVLISDSAPKSFSDEFATVKPKLNLNLLKQTIANNKLKNCVIIIPVFYVYGSDYCVNSFEPLAYINDNYFSFNGKPIAKMSFNMRPIIINMYKPLH